MRMNIIVSATLLFSVAGTTLAQDAAPKTIPATPLVSPQSAPVKQAAARTPLYDEQADAKEQIAAALAKAKKENRRVLIQWGGNWCPWCIRLHEFYRTNADVKKTLMYEYDLVHIDAGKPAGKNVELAKSYGADLQKNGYPFLTILDADGKPIANQETGSLEAKNAGGESLGVKEGYNAAAVLKFLDDHKATYQNANDRVELAIAEAKAQNKVVFLHFGAPWCVWCHRLEDWMARPEINAILAKHFIDCKIDEDRTIGGKDIELKYTNGKKTGIPVFFFIDGNGKVISSSIANGQNVGFPSALMEVQHFDTMLKSAVTITDTERKTLVDSLRTDPR